MTEGTKPTTKSRSMLLGYLLGHTSGLDTSISGDGLDYMRQAGASAIETQVRALGLSLQLASFAFANLEANASACADAVSERHTSNEALFFVVGLSLALIPIRKQQGLPTKENEERLLEASQRCGIRDIAESLLTTLQRNEEELATAVADAIQLVAADSMQRCKSSFVTLVRTRKKSRKYIVGSNQLGMFRGSMTRICCQGKHGKRR